MRRFAWTVALLTLSAMTTSAMTTLLLAAEIDIPPRRASENFSLQKGPPNCNRWTDECVNCTRGADGEPPVCSNIGFACQPKAIRCVGSGPSSK